jgi:hypothetical protein
MAKHKRLKPENPDHLDAAVDCAERILLRDDSPDGLHRAFETISATWPGLARESVGFCAGMALAALRERQRLLECVPILDRMPSREGAQ